MMLLGIETSCDETAAAVVRKDTNDKSVILLANTISSSLSLHAKTGGIIPEVAAREQLKYILPVIKQTLLKGVNWDMEKNLKSQPPIDEIAVTVGPGLIGSLLVGVETARTLSYVWNKPLIPVNHLFGHIYANWIADSSVISRSEATRDPNGISRYARNDKHVAFPALVLVVSGGHTDLVLMKNHDDITVLGGTRDDASGEAFDKIGRLLGLSYPAGPIITKLAEKGDPKSLLFPRPLIGSDDFDFSFSGLKTAVLNLIKKNGWEFNNVILGRTPESSLFVDSGQSQNDEKSKQLLSDLCASVQEAIVDVLVTKTLKAAKQYKAKSLLLGGGVAANQRLREQFALSSGAGSRSAGKLEIDFFVPPAKLCTDNAAMIAAAACFHNNSVSWHTISADPELYFKQPT
ncbi:MAG: tRNA (adenosine(37)-N6)-threonylcarbamoyltransferase complex transferase subunit TsaD [Candidatus Levybacteria bacterium]|nr:tRNA (adenosine(37)-N6)-threonylcarbamoyltransferase complex transferase subunit TsaD [Candidatus Levybacteria bacterium]